MNGEPKNPIPDPDSADTQPVDRGDSPEAKIQELMTSFEERIASLRGHITELEARLSELTASRDSIIASLSDILNLQDLGDMIRVTQDPLKVVNALERSLRKFITYDHLGIFLLEEAGRSIHPLGSASAELIQAAQSRFEEGIFEWVISERRPVIIPWTEGSGPAGQEKNLIIAPLVFGDRPLGATLVVTKRQADEFTAQDLQALSFAVSHAAVGIGNSVRLRDLTASRDFLQSLVENSGDVIFALDLEGKFTYLNSCIEELGYRKEELLGKSFQTLFRQTEVADRIGSVLTRGGKLNFDLEVHSRLTRHQQYHLNLTGLKNDRNEKIGVLGVLRNVTEAHHQQSKQLESVRLAAYTQTVIALNHEINNPLTAVLGNLYLLEKDARNSGNEKFLDRLKIIQENCQRIQKVIKKLERIEELKTVSYLGDTTMVDIGDVQK